MLSSPMLDAIRKKIAIEGLQNFSVLNIAEHEICPVNEY